MWPRDPSKGTKIWVKEEKSEINEHKSESSLFVLVNNDQQIQIHNAYKGGVSLLTKEQLFARNMLNLYELRYMFCVNFRLKHHVVVYHSYIQTLKNKTQLMCKLACN